MCEVFDVRSSSSSYFVLNRALKVSSFIHNCFPLELKPMSVERGIFYTLNLKRIRALSGPAISPVPPLHAHVLFDVTLPSYWEDFQYRGLSVLVRGLLVLVGGLSVLVRGLSVLVRGLLVLVRGISVLVRGLLVLFRGLLVLVRGLLVLVRGLSVLVRGL